MAGIEPTAEGERNLRGVDFFFLWAGAAVSLAEIWAGGLLVPLGFVSGLLAVLIGHLIGNTPLALGGVIGSRAGIPSMVSVRPSFGIRGSYFASILNVIQLVGWTGVMLWIGGQAAQAVRGFPGWGFRGWVLVGGIVTTCWALAGQRGWKWLQRAAVSGLLALCCLMTYLVFLKYGWTRLIQIPPRGGMPLMAGIDLVIAMPISWLPLVCDYSRFARSSSTAFWGTWIGYFLVSSWMYVIGLGAAIATNSETPDSMVMELMVSLGLAVPALVIVLFSTFTTTFLDIYSTAISSMNVWPRLGQGRGVLSCGVLGTALAMILPATAYEGFLLFIGSVFCPLFGVVLADYFVLRKRGYDLEGLYRGETYWYLGGFNPWAFAAWAVGFGLYHLLERTTSVGASMPSLVAAGALYLLMMSSFGLTFAGTRKEIQAPT
jgi:NCS1 family nucleobase:cation symporter-1